MASQLLIAEHKLIQRDSVHFSSIALQKSSGPDKTSSALFLVPANAFIKGHSLAPKNVQGRPKGQINSPIRKFGNEVKVRNSLNWRG